MTLSWLSSSKSGLSDLLQQSLQNLFDNILDMVWHVYFFSPGRHVLPLTMFWHVYFFRRICQACASLWTCFGMFISSAHLSGMRSSLDMFWHVYFFNCICQVCAALWTCFGMFISPVEPARHVLLLTVFSHLCCQVALTQR